MSTEDEHNPEYQGYAPIDIGIDDILQGLGISEGDPICDRDGMLDVGDTPGQYPTSHSSYESEADVE